MVAPHDLLVRGDREGVDLAELAATAAAATSASGPPVRSAPEASVALATALHGSATDAAKCGALSVPAGRAGVHRVGTVGADGRALELRWVEYGRPPMETLPARLRLRLRRD